MTYYLYLSSKHHHRALVLMPERILMDTKCMTLPMSTQRFDLRGQMSDKRLQGVMIEPTVGGDDADAPVEFAACKIIIQLLVAI